MKMEQYKCKKYINKLTTATIGSDKFDMYLLKINYWHNQWGGE